MTRRRLLILILSGLLSACGCATYDRHGLDAERAAQVERDCEHWKFALSPQTEQAILALDPEHITDKDIRGVLTEAPAPRIICIHGGISPVQKK